MRGLKILGYDYKVKPSTVIDLGGNYGTIDTDGFTIRIAKDVDRQVIESTMIHEILEAIEKHLELGLDHKVISQLEVGIYGALKSGGVDLGKLGG